MKNLTPWVLLCTGLLALAACSDPSEGPDDTADGLTKDEARAAAGKTDFGFDICTEFGWYGDQVCDPFCPRADPDCGSTDACEQRGWYGDGICDLICDKPDPDCEQRACGGIAGLRCGADEFCAFDAGTCGFADQLGTCETVPNVCTREFAPVCGCDANTYSNACNAAARGVNVDHEGECGAPAGCLTDGDCAGGEYCNYPEADACGMFLEVQGVCDAKPEICTEQFAPVCGCDGETYGNDCFAAGAGVNVVHEGECEPAERLCGVRGSEPCLDGEFCSFPESAMCGAADHPGVCAPKPEICNQLFAPVCGCDGNTYSNDCHANAAGVSVQHGGECEPAPRSCGGIVGAVCEQGEFCNFAVDGLCQVPDAAGTCEVRPEVCTREFAPVCGCDGQTYSNECNAHAAGVDIVAQGECQAEVGACRSDVECGNDEFCFHDREQNACGLAFELPGTCHFIPDVCTAHVDPVCGCDGRTYSNACRASGAGVNIASDGPCN